MDGSIEGTKTKFDPVINALFSLYHNYIQTLHLSSSLLRSVLPYDFYLFSRKTSSHRLFISKILYFFCIYSVYLYLYIHTHTLIRSCEYYRN